MSAQPLEELAEQLGEDCSFADVCESIVLYDERVTRGNETKQFALSYLWRLIDGDKLIADGKPHRKKVGAYRFHVAPPQEREYCSGCADHGPTLLYQCTTPIEQRKGVIVRLDSRPSMYITRIGDDE